MRMQMTWEQPHVSSLTSKIFKVQTDLVTPKVKGQSLSNVSNSLSQISPNTPQVRLQGIPRTPLNFSGLWSCVDTEAATEPDHSPSVQCRWDCLSVMIYCRDMENIWEHRVENHKPTQVCVQVAAACLVMLLVCMWGNHTSNHHVVGYLVCVWPFGYVHLSTVCTEAICHVTLWCHEENLIFKKLLSRAPLTFFMT